MPQATATSYVRPDLACAHLSEPTPAPRLAEAMRDGSRGAHEAAESSSFVQQVLTGQVRPATYLAYLERLRAVYVCLELQVDTNRHHPVLLGLHDERLARSAALADDIRHWRALDRRFYDGRLNPASSPVPSPVQSPAVAGYQARIRIASERPWLLVAHHYTRYLGDLSGGRILHRRLRDRFGSDDGLSFYLFPLIEDPVSFKRGYRDRLDGLPLDESQRAEVVAEVVAAFECNRELLAELDQPHEASSF